MRPIDRRDFIKWSGAAALGLTAGMLWPFGAKTVAWGIGAEPVFIPDVEIFLEAVPGRASILPGAETRIWSYRGKVLTGPQSALQIAGDSYLGPTFRFKQGQKVRIRFVNQLPEPSIIHWHGLHVPAEMDGHPRYAIGPGGSYTYEFEVLNRAGTYWYHPHPDRRTGFQVYGGLAGLFIVEDDREAGLELPRGRYDLSLVIQDRLFDRDNQLVYLPGGMMDNMTGMLGDTILANGRPGTGLDVETRAYRLRILNGSNARIYRLGWDDGMPLIIIGTDGGLLEQPIRKGHVLLAPGERIELWADFSGHPTGAQVDLVSLPTPLNSFGGGMGMMGGGRRRPTDRPMTIQRFRVFRQAVQIDRLPDSLLPLQGHDQRDAVNRSAPQRFELAMSRMQGTINGRVFSMHEVARNERVRLDALEVWEFENSAFGMGMMNTALPHPMHIHGVQFQVIERSGADTQGYVDQGWKDTVLVQPGESVRLLVRFGPYKGMYLYHCHNLEHEDNGMMRNFVVI